MGIVDKMEDILTLSQMQQKHAELKLKDCQNASKLLRWRITRGRSPVTPRRFHFVSSSKRFLGRKVHNIHSIILSPMSWDTSRRLTFTFSPSHAHLIFNNPKSKEELNDASIPDARTRDPTNKPLHCDWTSGAFQIVQRSENLSNPSHLAYHPYYEECFSIIELIRITSS